LKKKPFAFFSLVLFLCLLSLAGKISASDRPLLIAHRGAQIEADENTIKAFEIAIQRGVDYIETDPRLTKDGVFVMMHDSSVARTTNGTGEVSKMTLAEIKSLRTKNGEQVPTLEEVFQFAREHNIGVYLDTKEKELSAIKKLVEQVISAGMTDRVILGLWQLNHLKWVEKHHPEIVTCISWPMPPVSLKHLKKINADWVGTLVSFASKEMIEKAHKRGLKVITLEINDADTIRKKIEFGIDAILTDDPRLTADIK